MARGIIYVMETVVPGLVKIGKTGSDRFENRMYTLERNGYNNVAGLKRRFAIEVDNYDEKELLLDSLFEKSRVQNSELFALDIDLVIQLLSSFDGTQIYPRNESKETSFNDAAANRKDREDRKLIPDGIYYLSKKRQGFDKIITAQMKVLEGKFIVLKGSTCCPCDSDTAPAVVTSAIIRNNILQEDVECDSPSAAGWIVLGRRNNGWTIWKTKDGKAIASFRQG